jgi:hypothetical protein
MQVFCDNYLDGGYHVPYAHGALASGLQLQSYETLVLSVNPFSEGISLIIFLSDLLQIE